MSYNEKFGLGLLVIVCLYMAGVNLWLLFKDWLVEWSEKHQQEKEKQKPQRDVDDSQSIIGKSKLNEEHEKLKQSRLEQEVKELKEQMKQMSENVPIYGIPLEKEKISPTEYNQPVSSEEEIIIRSNYDKADGELVGEQSFTMDEFSRMTKVLTAKTTNQEEEKQIAQTIVKVRGTDMFQQFIGQVNGAESKANEILKWAEVDSADSGASHTEFNFDKYIRT